MALERYYSLFFYPYLKPIVGTLGGYWVLSREEKNEGRMGTSFMPSFSAPVPRSKANPHIASAGTSQDSDSLRAALNLK